jgi:hypothetical protein
MKKLFRHLMVTLVVGLSFIPGVEPCHSQNFPPAFDPVGTCYVKEGDTLNINLHATDPDGDSVKIRVLNSPPTASFTDKGKGYANLRWVPEFIGPYSSSGSPFEFFFSASDGNLTSQMGVRVIVINMNRPPQLILPDSSIIGSNMQLVFQVRAEDPDKEEVKISAVDLPGGASLDGDGMFSWTPNLADTGKHTAVFEAIDLSGESDLKETRIEVAPSSPYGLSIGIEEALVGGEVKIPIILNNPNFVSGMELLIEYDPSVYTFLYLTKEGTRASDWEYYVSRQRTWGLFQLIKIVGICDLPNQLSTPPLSPGNGPIAYLNFKMTSNTLFAGLLIPLEFYYFDFTDNTLSSSMGEFISREKISLNNGGVLIKAGNTLLGDLNMNGIPFEVGDAVKLAFFLTYGKSFNQQQFLNSDVNQDGYWATTADLIYLIIRIQDGGSVPVVEPGSQTEVAQVTISDHPAITSFSISSQTDVGGLLFVFKKADLDSENVKLSSEIQDMELFTHQNGDEFRVMIMSTKGRHISPGDKSLFTLEGEKNFDSVEVSVCDKEGNLMGVEKTFKSESNLPEGYALSQNYPNPFNPVTTIRFKVEGERLKDPTRITLKVYNLLGQLVKTLLDEEKFPGNYQVVWDGKDQNGEEVSSGIYFYKLKAKDYTETKKMVLLK